MEYFMCIFSGSQQKIFTLKYKIVCEDIDTQRARGSVHMHTHTHKRMHEHSLTICFDVMWWWTLQQSNFKQHTKKRERKIFLVLNVSEVVLLRQPARIDSSWRLLCFFALSLAVAFVSPFSQSSLHLHFLFALSLSVCLLFFFFFFFFINGTVWF